MDTNNSFGDVKHEYFWTQEDDLLQLIDMVHDEKVCLDDIHFNKQGKEVLLPLRVKQIERRKVCSFLGVTLWEDLVFPAYLIIRNVEEFELSDEAEVGVADINEIEIGKNDLTITCGLPVTFRFRITSPQIRLVVFNKVVGRNRFFSFPGWTHQENPG